MSLRLFSRILKHDVTLCDILFSFSLMNFSFPIGKPRITIPSVVSLFSVNSLRLFLIIILLSLDRSGIMDLFDMFVRMVLLLLFSLRPILLASFSKVLQKKYVSSCEITQFRSSTYASRFVIPPLLSSPIFPWFSLIFARCLNSLSIGLIIVFSTNAANTGLKGHPWGIPSS